MLLDNDYVVRLANELGFDLVGFARADQLGKETEHLKDWLSKDYNAGMGYMERNIEKRLDVHEILPSAQSVISLGMNYYTPEKHSGDNSMGKISRYAWGKDYHSIIKEKLDLLIKQITLAAPDFEAKAYVDTGPVMDKAWGVHAGIGWMGKHSNVISREIGSWFFIANIITNYPFHYSIPSADFCGSCTACIDACPTGAIVMDYVVDSSKCISYQTIENKGEIPVELKDKFENWIYGCDICQDVCPWNDKFSRITHEKDFYPQNGNKEIDLSRVIKMEQEEFSSRFKKSPVKRTKLSGLKRNARFILNPDVEVGI